mmetsp:Transcript_7812/g.20079  ORF Transcript_7812/g.20079 Transcript_7812/m.20079 type:complete len:281 (+) Transcript_7812:2-844(+)
MLHVARGSVPTTLLAELTRGVRNDCVATFTKAVSTIRTVLHTKAKALPVDKRDDDESAAPKTDFSAVGYWAASTRRLVDVLLVLRHHDEHTAAFPLHAAAANGATTVIAKIAMMGYDMNERNDAEMTALTVAARRGATAAVGALLQHRASVKPKDATGMTALHHAARNGDANIISKLLRAGAKVDVMDNEGMVPLHHAARRGGVKSFKLLLDAGSDINAKANNQFSPLHCAVEAANVDVVDLLLDIGPQLKIPHREPAVVDLAVSSYAAVPFETMGHERM